MGELVEQGISPKNGNTLDCKTPLTQTSLLQKLATCELDIEHTNKEISRISGLVKYEQREMGRRHQGIRESEQAIDECKQSLKEKPQQTVLSERIMELSDQFTELKARRSHSVLNKINPKLIYQSQRIHKSLSQQRDEQMRAQKIESTIRQRISRQEHKKESNEERIQECISKLEQYKSKVNDIETESRSLQRVKKQLLAALDQCIAKGTAVLFSAADQQLLFVHGQNSMLTDSFQLSLRRSNQYSKNSILSGFSGDVRVFDTQQCAIDIPVDLVREIYSLKPNVVLKERNGAISDSWESYADQHKAELEAETVRGKRAQTSMTTSSSFTTSHSFGWTVSPPSISF
ncbi:MAG: hypothetical protein P8176_08935 [Gammaproteobacteria bacterium]